MDRPLHAISGIVDAPVEATWQALLAVAPELQPASALLGIHTDVDPARHEIAQHGEWWYRGVVGVAGAARPGASEITRAIYNVAPRWSGWLVPFVHRFDARALRGAHDALLRAVAERLGCGYVVTGP
jgi:hypothetical protein